ncbi:MAG: FIST N-terminal domain-containing protein [Mariprofundales bacterium]
MNVLNGMSQIEDEGAALDEATAAWPSQYAPNLILVFYAAGYDAGAIAATLSKRFPTALVVGASSYGQWLASDHYDKAIVLTAICSNAIRWSVAVAENIDKFDNSSALALSDGLLQSLGRSRAQLSPRHHFCISLIDGLCRCEEQVISAMAMVLDGVPIIGGSAADDLRFEETTVIANGSSYRNAALFLLAESEMPFVLSKHHHFSPTPHTMVITAADEEQRIVHALDGYPAATRYAQLLGIEVKDLSLNVFSCHPLIYQLRDGNYIRAIGNANDDGSLQLYTAIEEGMVLALGEPRDMKEAFSQALAALPQAELLLMFNCTLRAVESDMRGLTDQLVGQAANQATHMVGFDTYGEQYDGLHMNQSAVMLLLGEKCE